LNFCLDNKRICKWVSEAVDCNYSENDIGIALEKDGELKIGVFYQDYTGSSIMMTARCDDPKYATRSFYHHIFAYPFLQLGCKVAYVIVNEHNARARKVDEHLGFVKEHILKDYFSDGDAIIYSMRKENCRFIGENNG
jgi:hypothetical protein